MPRGRASGRAVAVVGAFALSGAAGLVYQILWVRQFSRIFGNTLHSAALVTGVFMAGLGGGSFLVGRWSDRRYRDDPGHPLRAYGLAELMIGALGLGLAILLPRMTAISAAVSSYTPGDHGWAELSVAAHAARYAAAIVCILPATFLMGGTLPLVIRALVGRRVGEAGLRVGLVYGLNTAGAALAALLTDFALVPWLGIEGAQIAAVALNVTAGLAALAIARGGALPEPASAEPEPEPEPAPEPSGDGRRALALVAAAVLLSGFAAMGLEILWFRYLSQILGALRGVFSLLLAVILVAIWIGATAGGWIQHRVGRPALLFAVSQALLAITAAACLVGLDHGAIARHHVDAVLPAFRAAGPGERIGMEIWGDLRTIGLVVFAPALFMGASFPLANATAQRSAAEVAGRAGLLYLASTAGNVLGATLVGFVLLPALGIQDAAFVLVCAAAASAVPLVVLAGPARQGARADVAGIARTAAVLVCATAIAVLAEAPEGKLLQPALPVATDAERILAVHEGLNETLVVAEVPGYRTALYTNGHSMATDSPRGRRYMHAFAHLPLLSMDRPERVLVICFGTGNTLHAASLHPSVQRLEVAELSRDVLEHAPYFRASNHDVLSDPRTRVFVNDGRLHLLMQPPGSYDLITLEPPPIAFAGVASLYSRELYELARSRLTPSGYLTQWLPAYQLGGAAVLSMVRAFVDVFPQAVLLSGDDDELILMGTAGPSIAIDPADVERRLRERPLVLADLAAVDMGTMTEIAGTFAASYATLARATAGAPALTDDRPVIEQVRLSRLGATTAPPVPASLFDTSGIGAFCPACEAALPDLAGYLRVRGLVYASAGFLSHGREESDLPTDPSSRAAVAKSPYLTRLYGGEAFVARRMGEEHLARGEIDEAIGALRYALGRGGLEPVALELLGRAFLAAGQPAEAVGALSASLGIDEKRASAHVALAVSLAAAGQRDPAIHEYDRALELDPTDAEAHYDRGLLLHAAGKIKPSEADLEATLALDPFHGRANLVMCKRDAQAQRFALAIEHCDTAALSGAPPPDDLSATLAAHRPPP